MHDNSETMEKSEAPANLVSMPRRELTSHLMQLYGWGPLAIGLILLIPALAAGILFDIRWLIVFFLLICVVAPMILAFLFFYHGLRPSTASNLLPHSVEVSDDGIAVSSYRHCEDSENLEFVATRNYPFSSIRRLLASSDAVTALLSAPDKGFIWIPIAAFSSKEEAMEAYRKISENILQRNQ